MWTTWERFTVAEREACLLQPSRGCSGRGEESMTGTFLPLVMACGTRERLEEQLFLNTPRRRSEAHEFFRGAFSTEVFRQSGDLQRYQNAQRVEALFGEQLPPQAAAPDRSSRPAQGRKRWWLYSLGRRGVDGRRGYYVLLDRLGHGDTMARVPRWGLSSPGRRGKA